MALISKKLCFWDFSGLRNIGNAIYINILKNKGLIRLIIAQKWRMQYKYLKIKDYFVKNLLKLQAEFIIILTGVGGYAKFTASEGC